jgi:hypothetical protein
MKPGTDWINTVGRWQITIKPFNLLIILNFSMSDIDSIILPLLGTREGDYTSFQYIPLSIEDDRVIFSIPLWVLKRDRLFHGDTINLHLGIHVDDMNRSSHVKIIDSYENTELESDIYTGKILFEFRNQNYGIFISTDSPGIHVDESLSKKAIFIQSIRDCWMLKRGVAIYLKHLSAYFSRISRFPKDEYQIIKETLLNEPIRRIQTNVRYLEELYNKFKHENNENTENLIITFDLETFGSSLISELELELFKISFESELAISYIKTIKELEKRLFTNHNIIGVLYTQDLAF